MPTKPSKIKILFSSALRLHPKHGALKLGKYTIEPMPDSDINHSTASGKYMLTFEDKWEKDQKYSNPQREAELFLTYWSLLGGTKLTIESGMTDYFNDPPIKRHDAYSKYDDFILKEIPDFQSMFEKFQYMESKTAIQYLRACEVYKEALNLLGDNNTLSYFLLTISIECIANITENNKGSCSNFISFIMSNLSDTSDFKTEKEWQNILKEIYYRHRSGFTHGGKTIPSASGLADRMNRVYVKNYIDGKEVKTPGLIWFENIVRNALLGFLLGDAHKIKIPTDHFNNISKNVNQVIVKAKNDLKEFQPVFTEDMDID